MRMVFKAAEGAGWLEGQKRLDFMGFGLVQGQDGLLATSDHGASCRWRERSESLIERWLEASGSS